MGIETAVAIAAVAASVAGTVATVATAPGAPKPPPLLRSPAPTAAKVEAAPVADPRGDIEGDSRSRARRAQAQQRTQRRASPTLLTGTTGAPQSTANVQTSLLGA